MATIDRSLLRSGFDVEALFTGRYLQGLLTAAYDAGLISSTYPITSTDAAGEEVVTDTAILWQPDGIARLYPPLDVVLANGDHVNTWASDDQFATEILVDDPRGAKLRVAVRAGTFGTPLPGLFSGVIDAQLVTATVDGAVTSVGLDIRLIDIETDAFTWSKLEAHGVTHDDLLAKVAPSVDRIIAIDALAKGQRVEQVQIRWLPPGDAGVPALGVYLNLLLRTSDEPGHHLDARGDIADAVNFLPAGQDVAMATRDGLYGDARTDTWSRLASPDGSGWDHPLRKSQPARS